LGERK